MNIALKYRFRLKIRYHTTSISIVYEFFRTLCVTIIIIILLCYRLKIKCQILNNVKCFVELILKPPNEWTHFTNKSNNCMFSKKKFSRSWLIKKYHPVLSIVQRDILVSAGDKDSRGVYTLQLFRLHNIT